MKKLVLVLLCIVLLSGCKKENKFTCDFGDFESYSYKLDVFMDDNDKITKVYGYNIYESKEKAQQAYIDLSGFYGNYSELDGNTIIIKDLQREGMIYEKFVGSTKEEFVKYVSNSSVTCN